MKIVDGIAGFASQGDKKKGLKSPCAQRETRTPMPFRAPPPQDGVSTNFTSWAEVGDSAGARTQDPLIKSQMLYRLSYRIILLKNRSLFWEHKDTKGLSYVK
jgi:hypothetical protein